MGFSFGFLFKKYFSTLTGDYGNLIPVVNFILPKIKQTVNKRIHFLYTKSDR